MNLTIDPRLLQVLLYINLGLGIVLASSGSITAYFATLGSGPGRIVSLVLAGFGVVQTLITPLLHANYLRSQATLLNAQANAHTAGWTPTHKQFPPKA